MNRQVKVTNMPHLPLEVVAWVTEEIGRVSESNTESDVPFRDGRVQGGDSKGESPSLGSLITTGLSYSIV